MSIRLYQHDAVESVFLDFETHQSTLLIMATGLGKTFCATDIVKRFQPKRTLWLAHRDELIMQAKSELERFANITAEVEMAELKASTDSIFGAPVIVSSIQTQCAGPNGGRMTKFKPEDYSLLVIDECHRAVCDTYKKAIAYYRRNPSLKIVGLSATPRRSDEQALGQIFESVAFEYGIADAVNDGFLVPIDQQMIHIGSLDYSHVKTTCGDLNGAELSAVLEDEHNLQGMVGATIEIIGNKRTLVFASSVRHAEKTAEIFNRHRFGMANWICGETPKDKRRQALRDFADGFTQVMVNVGVLTEGYNLPSIECIVMARPTKSPLLYEQCLGRGTRPLAGVIDDLASAFERKSAIAASNKPSILILDFVGNSGKHKLISSIDILGGKYPDEVIAKAEAKSKSETGAVRVTDILKESEQAITKRIEAAKAAEASRKAKIIAKVQFTTKRVNPFDAFDIKPARERGWDNGKQLSEKQRNMLLKIGVDPDAIGYAAGKQLIVEQFRRWKENLCTVKQAATLKRFGYETRDLKMKDASVLLDRLAKNNWKKPQEQAA